IPFEIDEAYPAESSTQEAFGRTLGALARLPGAAAIVTVSADVAVTTHLAGWINRKGVYFPTPKPHAFADLPLAVQWKESPAGQRPGGRVDPPRRAPRPRRPDWRERVSEIVDEAGGPVPRAAAEPRVPRVRPPRGLPLDRRPRRTRLGSGGQRGPPLRRAKRW